MTRFAVLISIFVLFTGCKKVGVDYDRSTKIMTVNAEKNECKVRLRYSNYIQKYVSKENKNIISSYYFGGKYDTFIYIYNYDTNWDAEGYANYINADLKRDLISQGTDSPNIKNNIGAFTVFLNRNCRMYREVYFPLSENYFYVLYGSMDMKFEDYPCKKWMDPKLYDSKQKTILERFTKSFDESLTFEE